jgi:diguanylate cyclase (GGDEF)-like protein
MSMVAIEQGEQVLPYKLRNSRLIARGRAAIDDGALKDPGVASGRRESILVLTADAALARTLRRALRTSALDVECVDSLAAAVGRLTREGVAPFAAILGDAGVLADGDADGLRVLREAAPGVPVVVLTGAETEAECEMRRRAGAADCVRRDQLDAYWLPKYLREIAASRASTASGAQHDSLTGLPNRILLRERLERAVARSRRHRRRLAVLFIDVDRFKQINDSLGHTVGDALLCSTAQRLRGCVRQSDTVSRFAGDEFVLVLDEISSIDDAALIADKILVAMNAPHAIEGHDLHVTVSMGISIFPDDGADSESIIRNADIAMYHVKEAGRNSYEFFSTQMNVQVVEQQSVERDLRLALERGEFELYFQPKVALSSGAISGVEALVRWHHPKRGIVLPGQFIAVAESSGLIVPIGRWILRDACRQAREWIDEGFEPMALAVNISAVELRSKGFVASVRAALDATGFPPTLLELELTETALIQDANTADTVLRAVKSMGVGIALDDFGTGYSSLSLLKRFPVDTLKIDSSFVHDMTTDAGDAAIVRAVIAMARTLRRNVVAEGVETSDQLRMLRAEGCAQGQGFLFGRPATAVDLASRVRSARPS